MFLLRTVLLRRQKLLRESDRVDGAQRRSSRRQILRPERKVLIEDSNAGLADCKPRHQFYKLRRALPVVIEAHQRAFVVALAGQIQGTSGSCELLRPFRSLRGCSCRLCKWNSLSGNQRDSIGSLHGVAAPRVVGKNKRVHVIPVV